MVYLFSDNYIPALLASALVDTSHPISSDFVLVSPPAFFLSTFLVFNCSRKVLLGQPSVFVIMVVPNPAHITGDLSTNLIPFFFRFSPLFSSNNPLANSFNSNPTSQSAYILAMASFEIHTVDNAGPVYLKCEYAFPCHSYCTPR